MCTEQTTADNTSTKVGIPGVKSTPLNGSTDDLWMDTDDESFVRATQCMLDTVTNGFTSPMAVACSKAVTSTPNVKSSRCRRTFCLDPVPIIPHHYNMRPRHADSAAAVISSLPVPTSSPLRDVSFSEELLATLAEPDDVLDSQAMGLERHGPACSSAMESRETCPSLAGHDSFLAESDSFAQPELYSLIATAEGNNASLFFMLITMMCNVRNILCSVS